MSIAAPWSFYYGPDPGDKITFDIKNSSGGALTITWDPLYISSTYTPPANGKRNVISFVYDGTKFVPTGAQSPDM